MCSAALKKNDIIRGKVRTARSAARTKLEPMSKADPSKSGMPADHGLDRIATAPAREDENRCVARIHGKWAFSILRQLQRGPTQFSRLGSTLAQTSSKKLTQYLCKLEKVGLIVVLDRSGRVPQAEYALSDPLRIAAALRRTS